MTHLNYIVKTTESEATGLRRWLEDHQGSLNHSAHLPDPRRTHPVVSRVSVPAANEEPFLQIALRSRWVIQAEE